MREIAKPALSLVIICVVITFFVGLTYNVTKSKIREIELEALNKAMAEVLPEGSNFINITEEINEAVNLEDSGIKVDGVYESDAGYVFNVRVSGYGGDVAVIIGIGSDNSIKGVKLGSNKETPSLGKRAEEPFFTSRFDGLKSDQDIGISVDSISGVTITSSAVKLAVQGACDLYNGYGKGGSR
jgi:electron transport complex protein RnfG